MAAIRYQDITNATQDDVNLWLTKFNDQELAMITKAVQHETIDRADRRIQAAKADVAAALEKQGLSLEQVFGKAASSHKAGGTVAPKYRNPGNPSETWTGRGKQPNWLAAIVKDMTVEDRQTYLASIEIK